MYVQIYINIQIISKYSYISLYLYLYVMIMYIYKYLFVKYLYIYIYILHIYLHFCIYVYLYIFLYIVFILYILCAFFFENVKKYKIHDETFKIQLHFHFYKSSMDWQWNEKCKNYTQLCQLKKIKRTKSRLKRSIKLLLKRSEKIPYLQVKQKNAKS